MFDYYQKEYFGELTEDQFKKQLRDAKYYVNYITFNKAYKVTDESAIETVNYATCRVIDLLHEYKEKLKLLKESNNEVIASGVKSETVKSHSITFKEVKANEESELLKSTESIIYDILRRILLPTGLLYRGL